ncbi:MAG: AMP-binding protein [Proteobacteria bacterium]|nr:AMP-binding protein [Pseudomonadota bacterium]
MENQLRSGGRTLSRNELMDRAAKAAAVLAGFGIRAGDTVAMFLRNDFAMFEVSFAAKWLGAFPVAMNWHYTASEARFLLEDSGAKVVVVHADLLEPILAAATPGTTLLVVTTPVEIRAAYDVSLERSLVPAGMLDWDVCLESKTPVPASPIGFPGTVIYTSGTTGHAKGVRRAPPTPEQAQRWMEMGKVGFGLTPDLIADGIVTLITGPMYHSAPNTYAFVSIQMGAKVILMPRFDAQSLLELIEHHRVTHLHMVPVMFNRLLKLPAATRSKHDLSSLKFVIHGAAPCPSTVKRQMIEWWGPVINEYYASTETGLVALCSSADWLAHPGTVGRAIPHANIRVVDENGRDVPAGTVGEVICALEGIADFTYHGDDAKRHRIRRDDLVTLGDVGYLDCDGFLYLCDRANDMIISGGVNIYPAEIEALLAQVPGVADCAVFGIPDEEFGESVYATIERQPGSAVTAADVRAFLSGRIASFKIPKRIEFGSSLPREDSGKIFKRKLREPFWQGLARRI